MKDILLDIIRKKESELRLDGIAQLYEMIMRDKKPSFTHGIYLFAETEDNEHSSFKAAIELINKNAAAEIFFVHHAKWAGSPGYRHWQEKLERYVGSGRIMPIRIDNPLGVNTMSE